jgi:hypothetical protein
LLRIHGVHHRRIDGCDVVHDAPAFVRLGEFVGDEGGRDQCWRDPAFENREVVCGQHIVPCLFQGEVGDEMSLAGDEAGLLVLAQIGHDGIASGDRVRHTGFKDGVFGPHGDVGVIVFSIQRLVHRRQQLLDIRADSRIGDGLGLQRCGEAKEEGEQ